MPAPPGRISELCRRRAGTANQPAISLRQPSAGAPAGVPAGAPRPPRRPAPPGPSELSAGTEPTGYAPPDPAGRANRLPDSIDSARRASTRSLTWSMLRWATRLGLTRSTIASTVWASSARVSSMSRSIDAGSCPIPCLPPRLSRPRPPPGAARPASHGCHPPGLTMRAGRPALHASPPPARGAGGPTLAEAGDQGMHMNAPQPARFTRKTLPEQLFCCPRRWSRDGSADDGVQHEPKGVPWA